LVSQEPTLFAGTIRDNIAYAKENAAEAEIIEAATIANAHGFIRYHYLFIYFWTNHSRSLISSLPKFA
jgi:ABC-type multidrug transport system fused ATPase/permease subunit